MAYNKLNPLEKEVLIKLYRRNPDVKLADFRAANNVSTAAFSSRIKKHDADGLSGLYRTKATPTILPEGIEENEENLRRDLIRTRIELERLKKGYAQIRDADGKPTGYVPVYDKTTRS